MSYGDWINVAMTVLTGISAIAAALAAKYALMAVKTAVVAELLNQQGSEDMHAAMENLANFHELHRADTGNRYHCGSCRHRHWS